jgi:GH24 family phage-related lysozyme (muramidase)
MVTEDHAAMTREAWKRRKTAARLIAAATVVAAIAFMSEPRFRGLSAAVAAPAAPATKPKRMSDAGLAHIRQHEAFMAKPYDDGAGNATIGYGHLILEGENYSAGITEAQAVALFKQDVERVVNPALDKIAIDLTQNQVDALGSFIFNVGTGAFVKSLLPHVNASRHEYTTGRMLKYITGRDVRSGKRRVLRGLLKRRRFEVALYKNPTTLTYLSRIAPRS